MLAAQLPGPGLTTPKPNKSQLKRVGLSQWRTLNGNQQPEAVPA